MLDTTTSKSTLKKGRGEIKAAQDLPDAKKSFTSTKNCSSATCMSVIRNTVPMFFTPAFRYRFARSAWRLKSKQTSGLHLPPAKSGLGTTPSIGRIRIFPLPANKAIAINYHENVFWTPSIFRAEPSQGHEGVSCYHPCKAYYQVRLHRG